LWTGAGIVGGTQFSPAITGQGSYRLTYRFIDSLGCSDTASGVISVNTAPVVSISGLPVTRCSGDGEFLLSGSPAGGVWSGTGVSGSSFNPDGLSTGNYVVTYSITDPNGCVGKASNTVDVRATDPVDSISGLKTVTELASLNYLVKPVNGSTYSWKIDGGNRIGGASNLATIKWGRGPMGYITVYQVNQHGCEDSAKTTVYINATGMAEKIAEGLINGFPNPASHGYDLILDEVYSQITLRVFDVRGVEVVRKEYLDVHRLQVDFSELIPGTYTLQIEEAERGMGRMRVQVVR
jgi:hypothetical protein